MLERLLEVVARQAGLTLPDWVQAASLVGYVLMLWWLAPRIHEALKTWRYTDRLVVATAVLLVIAFWFLYPLHDSGQLGFASDRDDALDIGVHRLLNGQSPYACRALPGVHEGCPSTGTPIAPLPGGFLLAAPFVLLFGLSAVQNLFWLAGYGLVAARFLGDGRSGAAHMLAVVLCAPIIAAEVVSGGDLLANSLAVTAFALLALKSESAARQVLWGALLGIALAWRANFLLLTIPFIVHLYRTGAFARLARVGTSAAVTFSAVCLPLWLLDPAGFTPLATQQKIAQFNSVLPHASMWVIACAAVVGGVLGYRARTESAVLLAAATALLTPVIAAIVLNSIRHGTPTFVYFGWYGLSALFLGTLATIQTHQRPARPIRS